MTIGWALGVMPRAHFDYRDIGIGYFFYYIRLQKKNQSLGMIS